MPLPQGHDPSTDSAAQQSGGSEMATDTSPKRNDETSSRLKRTACVLCRKRKLKCDAARPKCSTCHRLGHDCEYNEVRKKSGPKRGYVKALEARLASVETQLKTSNDGSNPTSTTTLKPSMKDRYQPGSNPNPQVFPSNNGSTTPELDFSSNSAPSIPSDGTQLNFDEPFSWDMIALGLDEPLPSPEVMNELFELYFKKIHPTTPMVHRGRFLAALNLGPQLRPPIALRYAMWTLAAGLTDKYVTMQEHFYHRARKYIQQDEMRGFGEGIITLYHSQAWILLSIFEFKNMHFPRAWMSTGRAVRLIQMLGLHRIDGQGLEVKQCLQAATDWTEKEERRRTFWMAFWEDRCASIGTGWPMSIDEQDILTNLPASEEAYASGIPEKTPALADIFNGKATQFSNFGGAIVLTALFGRNLHHLHRPSPDDREEDLNGAFWERHRKIDAVLLSLNMNLPDKQRIPNGLPDPNIIFINMCIHTSVICLHQAAIFKIDKNSLPAALGHESKIRCVTAAAEIATLMRAVSHCELAVLNPFTAFCLYVASRVFVQYLKSRRNDQSVLSSLNFLLSAMHAMKRRNPLNESFLAQLEVDLEGANLPTHQYYAAESMIKKGIYPFKHASPEERCPSAIANPVPNLNVTEPSTIIPTNMQDHIGSSNSSEMTLPMCQPGRSPDPVPNGPINHSYLPNSSIGILGENGSVEEMDLSPGHSGNESTPSINTNRSGSTGGTAYTPPYVSSDGPTKGPQWQRQSSEGNISDHQAQQQQRHANAAAAMQVLFWDGNTDKTTTNGDTTTTNPQTQNTNFYHYNMVDGPGLTPSNPLTAPSPMNQQDFDNLTKQFFPTTPGADLNGWVGPTGLTPGASGPDEWNQILEGMVGWDNDAPRGQEAWGLGRGT